MSEICAEASFKSTTPAVNPSALGLLQSEWMNVTGVSSLVLSPDRKDDLLPSTVDELASMANHLKVSKIQGIGDTFLLCALAPPINTLTENPALLLFPVRKDMEIDMCDKALPENLSLSFDSVGNHHLKINGMEALINSEPVNLSATPACVVSLAIVKVDSMMGALIDFESVKSSDYSGIDAVGNHLKILLDAGSSSHMNGSQGGSCRRGGSFQAGGGGRDGTGSLNTCGLAPGGRRSGGLSGSGGGDRGGGGRGTPMLKCLPKVMKKRFPAITVSMICTDQER